MGSWGKSEPMPSAMGPLLAVVSISDVLPCHLVARKGTANDGDKGQWKAQSNRYLHTSKGRDFLQLFVQNLALFHLIGELFGRLEAGNVVSGYDQAGIALDVASYFGFALFQFKSSEAAQINVVAGDHGILYNHKKVVNGVSDGRFFKTRAHRDFVYDFRLCHDFMLQNKYLWA